MAAAATPRQIGNPSQRWLYGPLPDLLLGCGGLYAVAVGLLYATALGWLAVEWAVLSTALLAFLVNGPHYGATLLRVYEERAERRKYAFFSVYVTIALCALFVTGLHVRTVGSLLLTAYFTWAPWHFSGQNYGLAVMFLRRRGVEVTPAAKRALYGSFVLSAAVALIALHGAVPQLDVIPVPKFDDSDLQFVSLGIPAGVRGPLLFGVSAAYLACLVTAAALLLTKAPVRELLPSALLVLTQGVWFSLPALVDLGRNVAFSTTWIALAHSVQYLWVSSYFAQHAGRAGALGGFLTKCLLTGAAVIVIPSLLFAPDALGPLPYDAGLAIVLFSVINLHHFILDGAIWKLRDGRIARVLIRRDPGEALAGAGIGRRGALALAVWAAGAIAVGIELTGVFELDLGVNRALARQDVSRASVAVARLDRLGRESAVLEARLANEIRARRGSPELVRAHLERSLELKPDAGAWTGLGMVHMDAGRVSEALEAYQAALALDPGLPDAWRHSATAWLAAKQPDRALDALKRAAALAPEPAEFRRLRLALERGVLGAPTASAEAPQAAR
jgi:hypothetical protein